ncbi:MAG TPA: proton-conducting transporter membrane subunit, partial [Stellaceae bacterium]|nr:proton-conducting transporter membrane subunit [Stellaceae bacterium]
IFTVTSEGLQGAMFQMLSHGVVSAALFLCVGVVYDRLHTREIARYGGLVHNMPKYAFCFMVFTLASIGLPGTSGFVGEFLALIGAFARNSWVAFLAAIGTILSAAYMLYLYRRIIFEKITKEDVRAMLDLHWREVLVFAPMLAVVLWMGIYPSSFLKPMQPTLARVMDRVSHGIASNAHAAGTIELAQH